MGTNFYLRRIPSEEDIQTLHRLVDERKFKSNWYDEGKPDDSLQNMVGYLTEEIHICKRSGGWKICYDHNWGQYWQPNRKSIEEWLAKPEFQIVDEYGEEYTPEQFWKEMDDWDAKDWYGDPLFDSKLYHEEKQNKGEVDYLCHEDIRRVKESFGIDTEYNDFTVDNMRFAVFSDFS